MLTWKKLQAKTIATLAVILAMAALMSLWTFPGSAETVKGVDSVTTWSDHGVIYTPSSSSLGKHRLGTYDDYASYNNSTKQLYFEITTTPLTNVGVTSGSSKIDLHYADKNNKYYNSFLISNMSTDTPNSNGVYHTSGYFPVNASNFPVSSEIKSPAGMIWYVHTLTSRTYGSGSERDIAFFIFQDNYSTITFTKTDPMPK